MVSINTTCDTYLKHLCVLQKVPYLSDMNQTDIYNVSVVNTTDVNYLKERPYDHEGAMKFTVCVVLVYGVGVIGILSMYTHRKRKHIVEQETSAFMKTYANCRETMERKKQVSTAQSVIQTINDDQSLSSRRASQVSLASARPLIIRPDKLTLRTDPSTFHKLGNRSRAASLDVTSSLHGSSDRDELSSLIFRPYGSFKYKGPFLRSNSLRSERDRCILETPETEDLASIAAVPIFRFKVTDFDKNNIGVSKESTALNTPNDVRTLEYSLSSLETEPDSNKEYCTASANSSPSQSVENV